MFNWDDLKYFLAVARGGKLVVAAKALRVDHTTVSRRISALEQETGSKLFTRTENGYTLTAAGQRFLPWAEQIESATLQAQETIADGVLQVSGAVRIGAPDGFGSFFLAPRLPHLRERHPDLDIELIAVPRYVNLSKREADLSIALGRPKTGRVYARKLTDYQLQLFASKDYLAKHGPVESRKELGNHELIGYIDDLIFAPELRYMEKVEKNLHVGFSSTNLIAQRQSTLAGNGISVLPRFMTAGDARFVPVLENEVKLINSFWLLVHEDSRSLARVRETAEFIADSVKAEKSLFIEG